VISADERAQLSRIRASLGDWALADIKRAASPEVDRSEVGEEPLDR